MSSTHFLIVGAVGIAVAILFFPPFYKNRALPFVEYLKAKSSPLDLVGDWVSAWEPKAEGESAWVKEKIAISTNIFGKFIIKNRANNEGYSFTCYGKIYKSNGIKFLYGNWFSNSKRDDKEGRFLLTINPNGYMIGNFFGPNTQGVMMTGGWILAQDSYQLEYAKRLYEKGFVTHQEFEELKIFKII